MATASETFGAAGVRSLRAFGRDEAGATMVETCLIVAVMSVVLVATMPEIREQLQPILEEVTAAHQRANGGAPAP